MNLINISTYPVNLVLKQILLDKTTNSNILFATNDYLYNGIDFETKITLDAFKDSLFRVSLQPRVAKKRDEQISRQKQKAEVFTPAWLCNVMNNTLDKLYFNKPPFNVEKSKFWSVINKKIPFINNKEWQDYVNLRVLEITCGESPFIVTRYDSLTGKVIDFRRRVGILDRKLRVINENTTTKKEWIEWTYRAFRSCYGYEFSGDNLLIARINLLITFVEHTKFKWQTNPTKTQLKTISNIITWNFWQMDGLNGKIPYNDLYAKIINWQINKPLCFNDIKKENEMKFDFIIGNPPYQKYLENDNETFAPPVYDKFMDASYEISDKVCLITPARFLFNAGATSKAWNEKMLNDKHFKVLKFVQKSNEVFSNTDIKGGVAIHYRDATQNFGAMLFYSPHAEILSLIKKVKNSSDFSPLTEAIYPTTKFDLDILYKDYPNLINRIGSNGKEKRLMTNIFKRLPELFFDKQKNDKEKYCKILGLNEKNKRIYKFIKEKYIAKIDNFENFKVILPKSNGSGALGEVLSTPLIGEPLIGYTQTFISIGKFNNEFEAKNCLKFIKTKFARACLGALKITQDNLKESWKFVPLQDFSKNSAIDFSKSIAEIDAQLYAKYNLSKDEINFINSKVKAMDDE